MLAVWRRVEWMKRGKRGKKKENTVIPTILYMTEKL
jgi:hypothetical protein